MTELLGLIEQVLTARTRTPVSAPALRPLHVRQDPNITRVSADRLREFEGAWPYPPTPLGLELRERIELQVADGHLVGRFPSSGTFRLYLQEDGSFHQEDSQRRYVTVTDPSGAFAGIVDQRLLEREEGSR